MRAYAKREFHIDNSCHIFIKSGEYPKRIDKIIQNLEASLSKNNPPYRSLKDAVSSLLGIEFGTPAISPFVRLLAPVYVKIEESKATIENLKILVSASLVKISEIRLEMFGEDNNNKGKLDNKGLKSGIFVAPKGVTGRKKIYGADGQIDKFLQKDVKIIVLDDDDLCDILNCKDITEKIDDKFIELYKI